MKRTLITLVCCMAISVYLNAATVAWDNGGDGVSWTDPMNWDGDALPTVSDDVEIDGFTVTLGSTTTVQRVNVLGSGHLTIESGVTLNISGFAGNDDGLECNNSATIVNDGTINVTNINGGTAADGVYVRGTFNNNGMLSIDGTGQHGLYIQRGNFTNGIGAMVTITNTGQQNGDGDCVYVDDSSGVLGLLTNQGTMTITTTTGDDGVYVNDGSTFTNHSVVTISGTGDNGIRLDDGGIFNNMSGATFDVDGCNDDQIYVDNTGAIFNNTGTVNLTNSDSDDAGLYVIDNGTFNNMMGGNVNITGSMQYAIQVDANSQSAEIINSGTMTVNSSINDGMRIQEGGLFTNNASGVLNFNTPGDEAIQIDNPGMVNNMGTIDINAPVDHGMELLGTFVNSGGITLDDPGDNGIYLTNAGTFDNNLGGTINTTNVEDHSIQVDANSNATPATFTNTGTITLTSSIDHALRLQEDGVFTNNSGGILNIVSAAKKGILLESSAVLNNSGTIDIPAAVEEGMDMVDGTFNNMTGGIYRAVNTVDDGLEINGPSTLNNDGLLDIDGSGSEDIEVILGPSSEVPTINNTANATFTPGSSPGDLEIKGDFNLGASTITFEINGLMGTTEFDQILNFSGTNFLLLGTSTAHLDWGTFVPSVGDKFKIIDGSGLTLGTFSSVTSSNPEIVFTTTNLGFEIEIEVTEILPIELVRFSGEQTDKGIQLYWQTAIEINNEGFDIERLIEEGEWEKIGYVEGQGNASKVIDYTFLDDSPSGGVNYYRLKQNDYDGRYEYSYLIAIDYKNNRMEINLFPNPVRDVLYIDSNQELENVEMNLYDSTGKIMFSNRGLIRQIPFDDFESGLYFLEIINSSDRSLHKIIK